MINWSALWSALKGTTLLFTIVGLMATGAILTPYYWWAPIMLFGGLFIGTTIFFYIMID